MITIDQLHSSDDLSAFPTAELAAALDDSHHLPAQQREHLALIVRAEIERRSHVDRDA